MIAHTLLPTHDGKLLAVIVFDKEKALNAQDVSMVQEISRLLSDWQADDNIVAIVMRGAGEKAFCAGGDIKGLYYALDNHTPNEIAKFFEHEYALMYQLHTYKKPIIAWGSGIVMGGGLGLLAGASHKIVTQTTLMAMPEVSIGLFPDAGGSYFLNRMPNKIGLFLGLTGARVSGADAYYLGLADFVLDKDDYDVLIDYLLSADWSNPTNAVNQVLNHLHKEQLLDDIPILNSIKTLNQLMNAGDLFAIDRAIFEYQGDDDWIKTACQFYKDGSPITKAITYYLYHHTKTLSLKEILALELNTAIACCLQGDFKEGVRALLIDKDKSPNWQFDLSKIDNEYIKSYLKSPYGDTHPFDGL